MPKSGLRKKITVTILLGIAVSMIFSVAATTQSTMLFHMAYAQSKPTTEVLRVPFESEGAPLCGGEEVVISGTIHTVTHETQGPDGTFQRGVGHLNFQQATAIGVVTGTKYVINEANIFVLNQRSVSPDTGVIQGVVNGQLIGQGTASNTVFHSTFHLTFNANGQVTASVDNINMHCT